MTAVAVAEKLKVWRCAYCGRILAEFSPVPELVVRIKCHSCNTFSVYHGKSLDNKQSA